MSYLFNYILVALPCIYIKYIRCVVYHSDDNTGSGVVLQLSFVHS